MHGLAVFAMNILAFSLACLACGQKTNPQLNRNERLVQQKAGARRGHVRSDALESLAALLLSQYPTLKSRYSTTLSHSDCMTSAGRSRRCHLTVVTADSSAVEDSLGVEDEPVGGSAPPPEEVTPGNIETTQSTSLSPEMSQTTQPDPALDISRAPPAVEEFTPEPEPVIEYLGTEDLVNRKWRLKVTARQNTWLAKSWFDKRCDSPHEFTLLADGSVVWGGCVGGFGTGGKWSLDGSILAVTRSTPLNLITGKDVYKTQITADVNDKLEFILSGEILSYNARDPAQVIAEWEAVRLPGKFVMETDEDA